MAAVAELDASLQALRSLKAPGVTKSRIASITALCVENIKSESVLVQKMYTHFKKTPATHKLGVLYVVDSVTRQWIERATSSGQALSATGASDGTFAAGVHRVTNLLPLLFQDLIQNAPEDQKEKITKLVDIWDRGNIFPAAMLHDFKAKLDARPSPPPSAKTPSHAPSPNQVSPAKFTQTPAPPLPPPVTSSGSGAFPQFQSQPPSTADILNSLSGAGTHNNSHYQQYAQPQPAQHQTQPQPQSQPPQPALPYPFANGQYQFQQPTPVAPPAQDNAVAALQALENILPPGATTDPKALGSWLQILQELQRQGVPQEQWKDVVKIMSGNQQTTSQPQHGQGQHSEGIPRRERRRSRSPNQRRGSPVYGSYGHDGYRRRSPQRDEPVFSAQLEKALLENDPSGASVAAALNTPVTPVFNAKPVKNIQYDATLPPGNIKVYSRTLFIGGSTCSEAELRALFGRYGEVQTCIAHPERRHAFIKMCTRAESVAAKDGMENSRDPEVSGRVRSTRWGVGFGPRDCSDYSTGISIIPIDRLTEADRKWTLSAEYGGTGGKPIEPGLCMEEPDIEIGAGVSSKAISQRPSNSYTGRNRGPRGHGGGGGGGGGGGQNGSRGGSRGPPERQQDKQARNDFSNTAPIQGILGDGQNVPLIRYDASAFALGGSVPPAVPGFGFNFMGAPGT